MTPAPRPLTNDELREVRDSSRKHARSLSGIGIALFGAAMVAVTMVGVVVLDYRFHQPFHRVAKLLGAGALGLGVVLMPWSGIIAFPVVIPYLPWIPPIPLPGMNALNLLLGSVFCSWAITRVMRGQQIFRSSRMGGALGLFLALIVLGVLRGAAVPVGVYDIYPAIVGAVRAVTSILVFYVALCMVRGEHARKQMMIAIIIGLAAESVTTMMMGRTGKGMRAVGSIGQSNELGTFFAMYGVVAAAMIPAARNWFVKVLLVVVVAAAGFGVILSLSRAAMMAVAAGLFYVGLRSSKLLTVMLVLTLVTSPFWAPDYLKDRINETSVESDDDDQVTLDNASQMRVSTWQALFKVIGEHPFDGVGFNALPSVLPESGAALGVDVMDTSHNTFLRMLGELGILGLAMFVWVLWKCWALATATLRAARSRFDRQLAVGLGAATIALAISCAFGDRFLNIMISGSFWILCALAEDVLHEEPAAVAATKAASPPGMPPVNGQPQGAA